MKVRSFLFFFSILISTPRAALAVFDGSTSGVDDSSADKEFVANMVSIYSHSPTETTPETPGPETSAPRSNNNDSNNDNNSNGNNNNQNNNRNRNYDNNSDRGDFRRREYDLNELRDRERADLERERRDRDRERDRRESRLYGQLISKISDKEVATRSDKIETAETAESEKPKTEIVSTGDFSEKALPQKSKSSSSSAAL